MGITRIARVTGLDSIGIPVSTCIRPMAKSLSVAQGKGITQELADVSAVMESIEFFHAENPRPPDLRGTYAELSRTYGLIRPSRFTPGCFPLLSDTEAELDWSHAEDLMTHCNTYIPYCLIQLDQTSYTPDHLRFFISTNGLASGNTLAEATCHALYELIERDAVAKWFALSAEAQRARELRPDTVDGPCRELIDKLQAADIQVRICEATSSLGIPTFMCYIRGNFELRGLGTFCGTGAHFCRDIALSRALTEAAQSRLTVISGARDDNFPHKYRRQQNSVADHLPPLQAGAGKHFHDCARPRYARTFEGNLVDLLRRLQSRGYDHILRVNHTRPDFKIPVVHVFVPGMEVLSH
jgi:ribosomal protein S12 methylthiotransferase accessory factor